MLTDSSARAFLAGLSHEEFWTLLDAVGHEVHERRLDAGPSGNDTLAALQRSLRARVARRTWGKRYA